MKALIEDPARANHIRCKHGVLNGLGQVGVRGPRNRDRLLMSRALAPGLVTSTDVMKSDIDGKPLDRHARTIYSERFIHAKISSCRGTS